MVCYEDTLLVFMAFYVRDPRLLVVRPDFLRFGSLVDLIDVKLELQLNNMEARVAITCNVGLIASSCRSLSDQTTFFGVADM